PQSSLQLAVTPCTSRPSPPSLRLLSPFSRSSSSRPPRTYSLSLHDALPIWNLLRKHQIPTYLFINKVDREEEDLSRVLQELNPLDRKSTRLNSSHVSTSYAVFCVKKKSLIGSVANPYARDGATLAPREQDDT